MAFRISIATTPYSANSHSFIRTDLPKATYTTLLQLISTRRTNMTSLTICFVLQKSHTDTQTTSSSSRNNESSEFRIAADEAIEHLEITYLLAAAMSSFGITSLAVYYRFSWQMEGGEIPMSETFGTFALFVVAAVGMEFWSRWVHKALWHDSLWHVHKSHHKARESPFELNDVFAIINAVPAIALLSYGFFHKGFVPGLCFGAGLGITMTGIAYVFVHDGVVHRRFHVGPIADVPYLKKIAAAHQLHHSQTFNGVPYGFFLGPKELEDVGGSEELQKEMEKTMK